MARAAKKVGATAAAGKKTKKERKTKLPYDVANAIDADGNSIVNDDGLLTGVVQELVDENGKITQAGFNPREHQPLTKKNFVDEATFFDFKGSLADHAAEKAADLAKSYRKKATTLRQFGDEKTRKKASKLQKMREQAAKLRAELEAEGIDVSLLED